MQKHNNMLSTANFRSLYLNVDQNLKVQRQNKTNKQLLGIVQWV